MSRTMHPRIVAISGPLQGSAFPLGPFELVIGRDRSCDIRLDDPLVSRKHCGISHEGNRPFLLDMQSATGTFVNGFYFPAKMLLNGDRIRVGRSIFVYLDQDDAEVGSAMLMRTPAEEEWDRKVNAGQSGQRAAAYEAAMSTVLDAFLEFNGRINASRDADEIQSRVFELIFRVMPVEGVAILLRDLDTAGILSTTYRSILSQSDEPFPIDETVTGKALRDGGPIYAGSRIHQEIRTHPVRRLSTGPGSHSGSSSDFCLRLAGKCARAGECDRRGNRFGVSEVAITDGEAITINEGKRSMEMECAG